MNIIHSFHPEVKRRRRATGPTARRGKTAEEGERHAAEQRRLRQRKGIAKAVSSYAALHSRLLGWGKGRRGSLARLARAIELDGFADVPFPVAAVDVNSMVAAGKRRGGWCINKSRTQCPVDVPLRPMCRWGWPSRGPGRCRSGALCLRSHRPPRRGRGCRGRGERVPVARGLRWVRTGGSCVRSANPRS